MIIDFSNIGGGSGGGSYVLPIATNETLGGVKVGQNLSIDSAGTLSADVQEIGIATTANTGVVKIGSGINVDSAGTISVEGGQGVEVVTELPASGTDGQTVILIENIPEKQIIVTKDGALLNATAIGITVATTLFNYEYFGERIYVTVNPDNSISLYDDGDSSTTTIQTGETSVYTFANNNYVTVEFTVSSTGFTASGSTDISIENKINDIITPSQEKETLYTWSENLLLTASIDYTTSSGENWCVRYKYSEIPNNTLVAITKRTSWNDVYAHIVYENNELHLYESDSAETYTATTYTNIPQYSTYSTTDYYTYIYWTDDEIVLAQFGFSQRIFFNMEDCYRNGWHKEVEHKISSKAFYKDFCWYNADYNLIFKNPEYPLKLVNVKINPTADYNYTTKVYSSSETQIGPIFAPATTGTSGYVCVAGDGWAAPTWAAPSSLTGGISFWKGTQDEYDALGTYDNSTLYIITN